MFDPLFSAPVAIQIHAMAAMTALVITPFQLVRKKGNGWHRGLGYLWVLSMAATALTSFWIHEIRLVGEFSPIHLLSSWVLVSLVLAIRAARQHRITVHRTYLQSAAFWGLGVAGVFTFLPGRRMSATFFPDYEVVGFVVVGVVLLLSVLAIRRVF